ncbi:MAG: hypothetical protein ACE5GT_04995 [Rhodospirillales bacterium]
MSDQDASGPADPHQVFLDLLEESGFFQQIHNLEENLKTIADELKSFGEAAGRRLDETDNLAAHVLAMESILAVMLRTYPIEAGDLEVEIKDRTAALAGNADGSPTVHALATDILKKAKA